MNVLPPVTDKELVILQAALVIYEDRSYTVTGGQERAETAKELRHKIMLQTKKEGE